MVATDTMAIGGSWIAKDLLHVRVVFILENFENFVLFIFSKWKQKANITHIKQ
jgi:hypothetical protein